MYVKFIAAVLAFGIAATTSSQSPATFVRQLRENNRKLFAYTKGNFSVTDNGSFTYHIPLVTVPGTAGVVPNISLVYNSSSGTGLLGESWNIEGLSAISRVNKTQAQDNEFRSIDFSENDRLQLDGARLMEMDGSSYWSSANAVVEYRTEFNSQRKIKGFHFTDKVMRFESRTKEGLIYYYGALPDWSQQAIVYKAPNSDSALIWLVTRISDLNGNYIDFIYNADDLQRQKVRPVQIRYTGYTSSTGLQFAPYAFIDFQYAPSSNAPNPNRFVKRDPIIKWIGGSKIVIDEYLVGIKCYYSSVFSDENLIRSYKFLYTPGLNDPRKQYLVSIKECADQSANPDCMTIKFDWINEMTEALPAAAKLDSLSQPISEEHKLFYGDFNGDGFPDKSYVRQTKDSSVFLFSMNDKCGKFTKDTSFTVSHSPIENPTILTGDFNADGNTDYSYLWVANANCNIRSYCNFTSSEGILQRPTGKHDKTFSLPGGISKENIFFATADLNVDGVGDYVVYHYTADHLIINVGINKRDSIVMLNSPFRIALKEGDATIPQKTPLYFADLNGDGSNDILLAWTNEKGLHYKSILTNASMDLRSGQIENERSSSTKENFSRTGLVIDNNNCIGDTCRVTVVNQNISSFSSELLTKFKSVYLSDINHDGINDLLLSNTDKSGWVVWSALGKGNGSFENPDSSHLDRSFYPYFIAPQTGDFNGDGILDLTLMVSDSSGWKQKIAYGKSNGKFKIRKSTWTQLSNFDFSYDILVPIRGIFCPEHFLKGAKFHPNTKKTIEDAFNFGEVIPNEIWNNNTAVIEYISKILQRYSLIETPFFPAISPSFYDGWINAACGDNDFKRVSLDKNPKLLSEGIPTRAFGIDTLIIKRSGNSSQNDSVFYARYIQASLINYWRPAAMDLNGDGISDFILSYPAQPEDTVTKATNKLNGHSKSVIVINNAQRSGLIEKISLDNRSEIRVEYASVLDKELYPEIKAVEYPLIKFNAPLTVVRNTQSSNGIGGLNKVQYFFYNGIANLAGRGFLGFSTIKTVNDGGEVLERSFSDDRQFLMRGLRPVSATRRLFERKVITETHHSYKLFVEDGGRVVQLQPTELLSISRDASGVEISKVKTSSSIDKFANLVRSITDYGNRITDTIINEYYEHTEDGWVENWIIGRLKSMTLTKSAQGKPSIKRTATFAYNLQTGQLEKETLYPTHPKFELNTEYEYDRRGNKIKTTVSSPAEPGMNRVYRFDYNEMQDPSVRFVKRKIDPEGYTDEFRQNILLGTDMETINADGKVTKVELKNTALGITRNDKFGRYKKVIGPDGNWTSQEIRNCENCNLPNAVYFSIVHNSTTNLPVVTFFDRLDHQIRQVSFDSWGRPVFIDRAYDSRGRLASITKPYFAQQTKYITTYSYDFIGRIQKITHADNTSSSIQYTGFSETAINEKGQKVRKTRDALGRVKEIEDHLGNKVLYEYDLMGNLIKITDAHMQEFIIEYNDINQKSVFLHPYRRNITEFYDFNAFGENTSVRIVNGNDQIIDTTSYKYDKLGRLVTKIEHVSKKRNKIRDVITWNYIGPLATEHGKRQLKSVHVTGDDRVFDETYIYDELSRLKFKTFLLQGELINMPASLASKEFKFLYDYFPENGLLRSIQYPMGFDAVFDGIKVNYKYKNGQLSAAYINRDTVWSLINAYADGRPREVSHFGGITIDKYGYDQRRDELTSILTVQNNYTIQDWKYKYDDIGNINSREESVIGLVETFFYDDLNRLRSATTGAINQSYQYDQIGRFVSNSNVGNYVYTDSRIDIQNASGRAITYDVDMYGNRYRKSRAGSNKFEIEFNHFNKPRQLREKCRDDRVIGSTTIGRNYNYYYDSRNEYQVEEKQDYLKISLDGLYDLNISRLPGNFQLSQHFFIRVGSETIGYAHAPNRCPKDSANIILFHKDVLGSVTLLTDKKVKKEYHSFDVWGNKRSIQTWRILENGNDCEMNYNYINDNRVGYTEHQQWDRFGLINMGGRLYDPVIGQFLSIDAVIDANASTQSLYPYTYVQNNPTLYTDPSGNLKLKKIFKAVVRAAVGSGLFGGNSLVASNLPGISGFIDKNAGTIVYLEVSIALTMVGAPPPLTGFAAGFSSGFSATYLNGGTFSQSLEAGIGSGMISAVVATGTMFIGSAFQGEGVLNYLGKAAAHGTFQGLANEAQGGEFMEGFKAGAISSLCDPLYDQISGTSVDARMGRTAVAFTAGGVTATIGGGKFMNGAITATIVHLFNYEAHMFDAAGESNSFGAPGSDVFADYVYDNYTGEIFYRDEQGILIRFGEGYSGYGLGTNNPNYVDLGYVGPIPEGTYSMSLRPGNEFGVHSLKLNPWGGTYQTYNRTNFLIHASRRGDYLRSSSSGCIILGKPERLMIRPNTVLEVINSRPKSNLY